SDVFDEQLKLAKTRLGATRYTNDGEKFLRPTSLKKLFALMAENPEARLIAGATELGLEITKKFRKFPTLISLEAIPELSAIDEFFVAYRKTALQPGEILKAIIVPQNPKRRGRFFKVSKRREMDISTVAGCFVVRLDDSGKIAHARLAYGGVAAMPMRARKTE